MIVLRLPSPCAFAAMSRWDTQGTIKAQNVDLIDGIQAGVSTNRESGRRDDVVECLGKAKKYDSRRDIARLLSSRCL